MSETTLNSIQTLLNQTETKKQNLQKAFEHLQSLSPLLTSFPITWSDLDTHFSSLQSHLLSSFSSLQTHQSKSPVETPIPDPKPVKIQSLTISARPELKTLCENMDPLGLRKYIIDHPKERASIRSELADALRHAPDGGGLVLDGLVGFWDGMETRVRTGCVVLLEELMVSGVEIGGEVRERAKGVAVEWKSKMDTGERKGEGDEEGGLEKLGYLQLLASYKLLEGDGGLVCDVEEMVEYFVLVARYRQAVDLCTVLGLESRVSDIVQKLIGKGKQLLALKFILEFGRTDEFPPVPLLKAYVMDSKKLAQKVRKTGKNSLQSLNEAATKEISAMKSVIRCIEEHGLESEYSKDELVARVEKLEKEKADRKRPTLAPAPKPKNVNQANQNGNKRMKAADRASAFKRKQPSHVNRAGVLPDHHAAPYLSSSPYSTAGPLVPAAQYMGGPPAAHYMIPPADAYGLPGPHQGFSGNLNPSTSNPYASQAHAQAGYQDRAMAYGAYDPSQYHQVYYSQ